MAPPLPRLRFSDLDVFKEYASLQDSSEDDAMLTRILAGAEEFVERFTRRRFAPDPPLDDEGGDTLPAVRRRFTTRGRTVVRVPDLREVVTAPAPARGVVLYERPLLENQYYLGYNAYPEDGDQAEPATEITLGYGVGTGYGMSGQFAYVLPFGYRANDLEIWGRWGWNPTPPSIMDAVHSIASRRYRERDASWSDTVVTPDGGAMSYFRQLPASVQAEVERFRVPNWSLV